MKNQWLKDIVGDTFTDEMDNAVATHLGKNFVSKTDFNAKVAEVKAQQSTIIERDEQLKKLQALKPEELQAQIVKLQQDNAAAAAKYQKDLDAVKIDLGVESQLAKAGAVNVRALKALLDTSKLSLNPDGTVFGLSEQIANLQKTEKWGFVTPGMTRTHLPGQFTPGIDTAGAGAPNLNGGSGSPQANNLMNQLIRGSQFSQHMGGE